MKLVLVISSMNTGGAERVLSILANSWVDMGRTVTLITTHDDGSVPFYFIDSRVKLKPILMSDISGGGHWANIKRTFALRRIIKDESPTIVVSFLNYTNILVLFACLGLDIPVVISERLDPRVHRLAFSWNTLRRFVYPKAAILVNQTEAAAQWFRGWMGNKVRIISNPVMTPEFNDGPTEYDLSNLSLIAMGRLHHQKGFDTLLKAMRNVHDSMPDLRLTILGEGPMRKSLECYRNELGLEDIVQFPGRVKRPQDILKQAELFVLSSVTEGFPNVLCEAMAVGLPVVSTNCPSGPNEIIEDGKSGVLVPVGDSEAMAEAILSLMSDYHFRRKMGENARDVIRRFSLVEVLKDWEIILQEVQGAPAE